MGAEETEIKRLIIEAIRIRELVSPGEVKEEEETKIEFKVRELPKDSLSFQQLGEVCLSLGQCIQMIQWNTLKTRELKSQS